MRLRRVAAIASIVGLGLLLQAGAAVAQQEDPINLFVVDVRAAFPSYNTSEGLAAPLGLEKDQLAPRGMGLEIGAHLYPIRGRSIALGVGATMLLSRSTKRPEIPEDEEEADPADPTVRTRVNAFTPQISLNFGSRRGYSYISGGIGTVTRSIEATEGTIDAEVTDDTRARALNYGGGARWFAAAHVAFTFDLRFYRVASQEATTTSAALPSQRLFVVSAGVSFH